MRDIKIPTLVELLDLFPGWSDMTPAAAVTAIGTAEADDIFRQFATVAEDSATYS